MYKTNVITQSKKFHHLNEFFDEIICTNTLYRYIDLQLTKIKNINLKQKLRRFYHA